MTSGDGLLSKIHDGGIVVVTELMWCKHSRVESPTWRSIQPVAQECHLGAFWRVQVWYRISLDTSLESPTK